MRFIYTNHVKLRIEQRLLNSRLIEETIKHADQIAPSFKGRHIVIKQFENKRLEVVFKKLNGNIIIITAYWLKGA